MLGWRRFLCQNHTKIVFWSWVGDGLRAPLMGVLKGGLKGGSHHKRGKSGAKNAKLSTEACTVSRTPLTRGDLRLVRFYFFFLIRQKKS